MAPYHCKPANGPICGTIRPPGSKSITNRALITAAMADGHSVLSGILLADDTRLMIEALRTLGIAITVDEDTQTAEITGCGGQLPESEAELFCGNAGTVMRFGSALVAAGHGQFRLDGVSRMRQRPIGTLVAALRQLGTQIEHEDADGYPPLVIHARGFGGGTITIDAPESSQMVSALLLAAPQAMDDVMIDVTGNVPSAPYLKMTTAVMERFSVGVIEQYDAHGARFIVSAPQRYEAQHYTIEPDASNASYFLAMPAIVGGCITVEGLGTESIQGDAQFADVLQQMGCTVERQADSITVRGPVAGSRLRGITIDLNDMPDVVQTLAVVALFAEGETTIRNVGTLRVKETDRIAALANELTKLGAGVRTDDDSITITPPAKLLAATIDTYDDHRMAMSFALAGLVKPHTQRETTGVLINNPECCAKTFPDFFDGFESLQP